MNESEPLSVRTSSSTIPPREGMVGRVWMLLMRLPIGLRFLLAGGTGTVINLLILYVLTDVFHIWYLVSTSLAFVIGSVFSFGLQKFFTFQHRDLAGAHREYPVFIAVGTANLILNGFVMYTLVDGIGIHYLLAQLISTGLISIESFIMYRMVIFRKKA